jgi:hypothetical protein
MGEEKRGGKRETKVGRKELHAKVYLPRGFHVGTVQYFISGTGYTL